MKLVLHIGTEKTGTTAFQVWMHENTAALRGQGVWYAQSLDLPTHHAVAVIARPSHARGDAFRAFGLETAEDHQAFCARTVAALSADVAAARAAGATTFLISSEHCHSRLRKGPMVERLAGILRPLFDEIEVVCFLRPQIDTALSLVTTGARVGMYVTRERLENVRPDNPFYDYAGLLDRYAAAFGAAAVTPVPFRRHPRPIAYFRERLGIADDPGFTPERRINRTLDYRVIALSNHLIGPNPQGRPRDLPELFRRIYIEELDCETPLTLARAEAEAIQAHFAGINRAVADRWPQIEPADLEPDWSRYPERGTFDDLETCDFSGYFQEILGRYNGELSLIRAKNKHLESMLAEASDDGDAAVALAQAAIEALGEALIVEATRAEAEARLDAYRKRLARLRPGGGDAGGETRNGRRGGGLRSALGRVVSRN